MKKFNITNPPEQVNASNILIRLFDTLQYRLKVACFDLNKDDYTYQAPNEVKTINELLTHIQQMMHGILIHLDPDQKLPIEEFGSVNSINEIINQINSNLQTHTDEDLTNFLIWNQPIWNLISGPLSDSIAHVGQINLLRRMNNNPIPQTNFLKGETLHD